MESRGTFRELSVTRPLAAAAAAALTWALWMAAGTLIYISFLRPTVADLMSWDTLDLGEEEGGTAMRWVSMHSVGLSVEGGGGDGVVVVGGIMAREPGWRSKCFGCPCKKQQVTTPQPRNNEKWTSFSSSSHCGDQGVFQIYSTQWDAVHLARGSHILDSVQMKNISRISCYGSFDQNHFCDLLIILKRMCKMVLLVFNDPI